MKKFTNLYPCSHYEIQGFEDLVREAAANGYKEILPDCTGYVLVNNLLVPFNFVERVAKEIAGVQFQNDCVLSADAIFGTGFLQSLDEDERKVLMPCVLLLIERGDFELNVFESEEETA